MENQEILHIPSWDELFMSDVYKIASKSKDTKTKIGCIFVRNNERFSGGYNGMPREVDDTPQERYERPEKYFWFEHAERNAIYNCARNGRNTLNSTCYTQAIPCSDCARGLIQCGIIEVVLHKEYEDAWNDVTHGKWIESSKRSLQMFSEAGVKIRYFSGVLGYTTIMDGKIHQF